MDVWNQSLRRLSCYTSKFRIFGVVAILGLMFSGGAPAFAQTAPDLVVNDGAVTQTTGALIIRNRVYNQGTAAATSNFTVGFYGSTNLTWDPSDPLICSRTVPAPLAAGAYDPPTGSVNTDCSNSSVTPGVYYKVIMKVDTGNTVAESQENNNTVPLSATNVPIGPDLMFGASLAVTQDASGITINDRVYNGGNAAAGPFTVGFYASTDTVLGAGDQPLCTRPLLSGLAAGAYDPPIGSPTASTTCSNGSVTPGTYYVIAKVDSGNVVAESRETNNVQAYTNQRFSFGADLFFASDINVAYFGQLVISDQIVNAGNVNAGAFTVGFYASADRTWDAGDQLICSRAVVAGLAAWTYDPLTGRADTTCTNSTVVPGQYYVVAKVDSGNSVTEYNETNNTNATWGLVEIGPDLSMDSLGVKGSGQLYITDRVYNGGNADAATFTVGFYLSLDTVYQPGSDSALIAPSGTPCVRTVSGLAPAGYNGTTLESQITCLVGSSVTPGSYYVIAVADSGAAVAESDESNNTLATGALVTIGPGTVCESITPNSGQVGDTVALFGTGFGNSQPGASVLFNGVAATVFVTWSETEIHVQVPAGATTGPVNVVRTGSSVPCNFTVITSPGSAVDWDIVNFATPPAMLVGQAKDLELWVKNMNDTVPVGFTYQIVGTIDGAVVYDSGTIGPVGTSTGVGETFYDHQTFTAPNNPGKTVFFTLTVTDADSDVDVATDTTYLEPNYTLEFLPPVTHTGQAFKLGSVIPVKFRLVDIATGQPVSPPPTAFLWIGKVTDNQLGQEIPAESVATPDVGNRFRYVESEAQYHFNWDTSSLSTGTWRLRVDLGDGIDYTIEIDIRP